MTMPRLVRVFRAVAVRDFGINEACGNLKHRTNTWWWKEGQTPKGWVLNPSFHS